MEANGKMSNEIYDIRLKRDTYANLTSNNPIIREGQNVLEYPTELNKGSASMKVGQSDESLYNDLPYVLGDKSDVLFASELDPTYKEIPDGTDITHSEFFSRTRDSLAFFKENYHEVVDQNVSNTATVPTSKVVYDAVSGLQNDKLSISDARKIIEVTLPASGWTGTADPYSQTISVEGITVDMNPQLVSMAPIGSDAETQKAYEKVFNILTAGTGSTDNGTVTFYVHKLPESDITVGLKDCF